MLLIDLENILKWCDEWQLDLNLKKCAVINFFKKKNHPQDPIYNLSGVPLDIVESVKYLGVTLTNNLSWGPHISKICGKANKKMGFIKRIVGKSDEKVKERCYFALVRPHLEYACSIWDPADKKNIREIEKVQRRAARFVKNCYDKKESVTSMLTELGWESLEERRFKFRLRLLEKFRNDSFSADVHSIIRSPNYLGRKDHECKIKEIDALTNRLRDSFFPRTIRDSNRYPSAKSRAVYE